MQPPHSSNRNRRFLLRDEEISSCGDRSGGEASGGYAYFCPSCGDIWGKVETGGFQWMAVSIPCSPLHGGGSTQGIPGSFLKPLLWWDTINGNTLAEQLRRADSGLLHYEALQYAKWMLKDEMPPLQRTE